MALVNKREWDTFLKTYPNAHILQTSSWGTLKEKHGWFKRFVITKKSGAQILLRKLPMGLRVAYIPKGPIGSNDPDLFKEIVSLSKKENVFVIYIEPDEWMNKETVKKYASLGFSESPISIQPRRTVILTLQGDEADWLANMKQKTRYNIRLARKKGIVIERSNDISAFNTLIKVTGSRDKFGVHSSQYYIDALNIFSKEDQCILLLAKYEGTPVAGIIAFARGERAWYLYGASSNLERNRMPTYLLQWEGMKWAASLGCTEYDLWGVPDEDHEVLEENFSRRADGLWGVYRFKRGFGGEVKRTTGAYQKIINYPVYIAYSALMKIRKSQLM